MKSIILSILIFFVSCSHTVNNGEINYKFNQLKPPIVVVSKDKYGDVLLKDSIGTYLIAPMRSDLSYLIYESYNIGDIIK